MNGQNNNNNTVTDAICGRNAVRELIRSGKPVDKILVQRGEREGSIRLVVAEAVAAGIPVVEVDRHKIASYSPNAQGVCALANMRRSTIFSNERKKRVSLPSLLYLTTSPTRIISARSYVQPAVRARTESSYPAATPQHSTPPR